ncbi:protein kinase domain-containing protein [Aureimonas jatrophae]|uniref:Protein kinase domain-containing protein n=1 Tax=Aureimonas jatrophae TaxID=1166073 RepID=A0A1H0EUA9_9HYPH|nr:hypothetical protein [Aureimonas jatrophae]MBB3950312.1 serine/threonine protein kinase [Aureimonas jatrophae]SDN85925.1 Protein kinase domain-containing protein [Aureimonas jatrophae]
MSQIRSGATLNVSTSTIQEAQNFLSKAADDRKNIYGRQDSRTGEITLYAKSGTSTRHLIRDKTSQAMAGLRGQTGASASHFTTKQALGREGVQKLLERALQPGTMGGSSTLPQRGIDELFKALTAHVEGNGSALRAADLAASMPTLDRLAVVRGAAQTLHAAASEPKGARISDIGAAAIREGADALRAALVAGRQPTGADLADALRGGFAAQHPDRADQMSLMLRSRGDLKEGVASEVRAELDRIMPGHGLTADQIGALANEAVDIVGAEACGVRAVPGSETQVKGPRFRDNNGVEQDITFTIPAFTQGDKTFSPQNYVTAGGFGHILTMREPGGAQLIMKVPIVRNENSDQTLSPTPEHMNKARQAARTEIENHLRAEGSGHDNVLRMVGAMELPDGNIGILLEYADGGSVDDLQNAMNDPSIRASPGMNVQSGQVSDADVETMTLTVAHEMLLGLHHLHETQNVTSTDSKHANTLLVSQGTADNGLPIMAVKLSDFGTLAPGSRSVPLSQANPIDSPAYMAPEFDVAQTQLRREQGTQQRDLKNDILPHLDGRIQNQEGDMLFDAIGEAAGRNASTATISEKVDIWGTGVSLVNMMSGQNVDPNALAAFAGSPADAIQPGVNGAVAPGALFTSFAASPATINFMNDLMRGSPDQRLDAFAALRHPALRQAGVVSNESKVLIGTVNEMRNALRSNDPNRIAQARANVDLARAELDAKRQAIAQPFVPPAFRTSVSLPAPPLAASNPPSPLGVPANPAPQGNSLRREIDDLISAVRSGDKQSISAASLALSEGIDLHKGPVPAIPTGQS